MPRLRNMHSAPLGLPSGELAAGPGVETEVSDEALAAAMDNASCKLWLDMGMMALVDAIPVAKDAVPAPRGRKAKDAPAVDEA